MNLQKYSIGDLEKLTGIKAHTIRIWEKRYGIINPERTNTNIRYYSVSDLQRLLNISFLNRHGWKISRISRMTDPQIFQEVTRISNQPGGNEGFIPDLIQAVTDLDEDRFEGILNSSILKLGFEDSFNQVVFPLLEKIGLMWQIGKINACQERFVNNLIRHKLVVASDGMTAQSAGAGNQYLLFLPAGHYDETMLLYANYLLRKHGMQILYLGPSIPLDHLKTLNNKELISHLVIALNKPFTDKESEAYFNQVRLMFPGSLIAVITLFVNEPDISREKIIFIHSAGSLIHQLLPS